VDERSDEELQAEVYTEAAQGARRYLVVPADPKSRKTSEHRGAKCALTLWTSSQRVRDPPPDLLTRAGEVVAQLEALGSSHLETGVLMSLHGNPASVRRVYEEKNSAQRRLLSNVASNRTARCLSQDLMLQSLRSTACLNSTTGVENLPNLKSDSQPPTNTDSHIQRVIFLVSSQHD
jgi:hypothetical protein